MKWIVPVEPSWTVIVEARSWEAVTVIVEAESCDVIVIVEGSDVAPTTVDVTTKV